MLYSGSQYRNGQPTIWTVYSAEDGGARLSGVGLRSPDTGYIFTVPVKETGRWHDARCSFISICVPHSRRGNGDFSGVLFHEACWALLEECLLGKPVPLEQFLDVFQSLVFTHGLRSRHSLLWSTSTMVRWMTRTALGTPTMSQRFRRFSTPFLPCHQGPERSPGIIRLVIKTAS